MQYKMETFSNIFTELMLKSAGQHDKQIAVLLAVCQLT